MPGEGPERFRTDVVFHSLGVRIRNDVGHSERTQKFRDDLMAPSRILRQFLSGRSQKNGTIRLCRHQSIALQALEGAVDRDVGDAEAAGEISNACFAGGGDQFGNHLRVVLGRLLGVFLAGALQVRPRRGRKGLGGGGHAASQAQLAKKGKPIDDWSRRGWRTEAPRFLMVAGRGSAILIAAMDIHGLPDALAEAWNVKPGG